MLSAVILPTAVAAQQLSPEAQNFCTFSGPELNRQLREYTQHAGSSRSGSPAEMEMRREAAMRNLTAVNQLIAARKAIPCP